MTTFDMPTVLKYRARFHHQGATIGGGRAVGGQEQVVVSPAHRWYATVEVPILRRRDRVLAFRALKSRLKGRANFVRIGPRDLYFAPWGTDTFGRKRVPGLYRDPTLDGTIYAQDAEAIANGLITARVALAATMNGTALRIQVTSGGAIEPGQYFGLPNDHMHMVADVTSVIGGDTYVCTIWPWLRENVSLNASVDLATPTVAMRMTDDGGGREDFGPTVALEFEEVF